MLRDSATSDDTQPCGEKRNIHKYSQVLPSLFLLIWLMCSWRKAGDSQRHAGLSQAVQRQAERFDPLGGTERADHHGETRRFHNAETTF